MSDKPRLADGITNMSTARIRRLNDAFRYWGIRLLLAGRSAAAARFGKIVVTSGIAALPGIDVETVLRLVMNFRSFTPDNDPYREHDFGALAHDSARILWKIDYFAPDLQHGSADPSDPSRTVRVLTIMLAQEY
jgi:Protein of unknown function (DUF3768)